MSYINLHTHSDFSNIRGLDSTNSLDRIFKTAANLNLSGIALTDHETLSGHIKFLEKFKEYKEKNLLPENFKAILGNEIYLCRDGLNSKNYIKGEDGYWHFILIALDEIGHYQLRQLSSLAWSHSFYQFIERVPTYYSDIENIIGSNKGHIIGSTACIGGQFPKLILKKEYQKAYNFIEWCISVFGKNNFFIEMQPGLTEEQILFNKEAEKFSIKYNVPLIITTDAHYPLKEDRAVHKAFLTSNESEREVDSFYEATYFMSKEEIISRMDYLMPETIINSLDNTVSIGSRVVGYDKLFKKQIIPRIPFEFLPNIPNEVDLTGIEAIDRYFSSPYEEDRYFAKRVLYELNKRGLNDEVHLKRLEWEFDEVWVVSDKIEERLSAYFITISKIIDLGWNEADTIIGPWRGSIGAMLFAYLLDIIQDDPLNAPTELPPWR